MDILGKVGAKTRYEVQCIEHLHEDGSKCLQHGKCGQSHTPRLKWADGFWNTVVTEGLNALLNNTFNAAAASVNWYVFLKGGVAGVVAGDTMGSHGGWSEEISCYAGDRPAWTKNGAAAAGAMSNSSAKAAFAITGSATITGCGLTSVATRSNNTGKLYGAGDFSGSRAVQNGDTLNVQVDASVTAS